MMQLDTHPLSITACLAEPCYTLPHAFLNHATHHCMPFLTMPLTTACLAEPCHSLLHALLNHATHYCMPCRTIPLTSIQHNTSQNDSTIYYRTLPSNGPTSNFTYVTSLYPPRYGIKIVLLVNRLTKYL